MLCYYLVYNSVPAESGRLEGRREIEGLLKEKYRASATSKIGRGGAVLKWVLRGHFVGIKMPH